MLAIRMQRTGRKGHPMFRVVVQDSRRTPTSGKIVTSLGSFDPHLKAATIDKEKASFYLSHGARPSDRTARLLMSQGIKMPAWVKLEADKERTVRNADKRRSTRPAEPVVETAPAAAAPDVTEADATASEQTDSGTTSDGSEEKAESNEAPATEAESTTTESSNEATTDETKE